MQPNIIHINDPVTIIGDIHGQFYDLVNILTMQNWEHKQNFLFLGDYVDRGMLSIQVMVLILALKINSPKRVIVLRGNHECRQLTTHFNFRTQCLQMYDQQVYENFIELFTFFPLAAMVNRKFLCLHGGISTNIESIQDIMKINRFSEVPQNGLFCDLLWADPVENSQGSMSGLVSFNEARGCSYNFGYSLIKNVFHKNQISCIVRAHEAKQDGYEMHKWAGQDKFPPVITVFSAPNYCDFYNNKGAILRVQKNLLQIKQIQGASRPFHLPNNMSLFQWTVPFIAQKLTQMFHYLLKPDDTKIAPLDEIEIQLIDKQRIIQQLLKLQQEEVEQKMQAVKYQGKVLGEELMTIDKARDYVLNNPQKNFDVQKSIDKINEKRPALGEKLDQSLPNLRISQLKIDE